MAEFDPNADKSKSLTPSTSTVESWFGEHTRSIIVAAIILILVISIVGFDVKESTEDRFTNGIILLIGYLVGTVKKD